MPSKDLNRTTAASTRSSESMSFDIVSVKRTGAFPPKS